MSDDIEALFEGYSGFTKTVLVSFTNACLFTQDHIHYLKLPVAVIGFFLNIFHIFILSRKSMRETSINIWLMGLAFCDLFYIYHSAQVDFATFLESTPDECTPPESYFHQVYMNTVLTLVNLSRKLNVWIVLIMALARVLIISNPMSSTFEKLSKPFFAIVSIIVLTLYNAMSPIYFILPATIVEVGKWIPDESCGFPANYSLPHFQSGPPSFMPNIAVITVLAALDSFGKFLTTLGLIIITLVLVRILRKAEASRKKLQRNNNDSSKDNTTKLVTVVAISFCITELPIGLFSLAAAIIMEDLAFFIIAQSFMFSWNFFILLNSVMHFIICVVMSSQYRTVVKSIFPCLEKKHNRVAVINPASTAPSPSESNASLFIRTRHT